MPYSITWDEHGAYRRFCGIITKDDVRQSFKELHEHPEYERLRCILHDETQVTGRAFGKDDILLLGANHLGASVSNPTLIDIVVTTDDEFIAMLKNDFVTNKMPTPIEFFSILAEGEQRYKEIVGES